MTDELRRYRSKRDFSVTPEPDTPPAANDSAQPRFVVQEHHARRLHWDLRLERDGVLVSWAIPKGIPTDPRRNHLAVHVEDHPLSYVDFAGEIPRGEYGAGTVEIWDSGTYETHKFRDDEVIVTFHGERIQGRYALFQTKGQDWMIHRMDPPVDPQREPLPERLAPMLAKPGVLPRDDDAYGYEIKWDGVRALVAIEAGRARALSRNQRDITGSYPELRELGRSLGTTQVLLDGELVAFDDDGRPDFSRLQRRMHVDARRLRGRLVEDVPVVYVIFDLLHLEGRSTLALPYAERRGLLDELGLEGASWRTPSHHVGDGPAMVEASHVQGLEGVIAKRLDSPYEPGRRSGAWLKIKHRRRTQLVVGGWMPGEGGRRGSIGSLLVGYYDADAALRYAGRVGSGLADADLHRLNSLLGPLHRDDSPFEGRQPPRTAIYVEPHLVVEVEFAEWTRTRTLRAPTFRGLVEGADPRAVVDPG